MVMIKCSDDSCVFCEQQVAQEMRRRQEAQMRQDSQAMPPPPAPPPLASPGQMGAGPDHGFMQASPEGRQASFSFSSKLFLILLYYLKVFSFYFGIIFEPISCFEIKDLFTGNILVFHLKNV